MANFERHNNIRNNSRKKCSLFAVTVPYAHIPKIDIFNRLEDFCKILLITEEKHFNDIDLHHHLYLRTKNKYTLMEMQKMLYDLYDITPINDLVEDDFDSCVYSPGIIYVGSVRKEKQYVAYITKYDQEPIYKGLNERHFSFGYRAIKWAKKEKEFKYTNPFVLEHSNNYHFLQRMHAECKKDMLRSEMVKLTEYKREESLADPDCPPDKFEQIKWANQVIEWMNGWIKNGRTRKDSQLYLWGPPSVGKTRLINHILFSCLKYTNNTPDLETFNKFNYEKQIFQLTPNEFKYAWETFDPIIHQVILIDEFSMEQYEVNSFKKALSGESFSISIKNHPSKVIRLNQPCIIISHLTQVKK